MRRRRTVCALIICAVSIFAVTPAFGAVLVTARRPSLGSSSDRIDHAGAAKRRQTSGRTRGLLLGASAIGSASEHLPAGTARAFGFKSSRSGKVRSLIAYLARGSGAKRLQAGLYSARHGHPGRLLTFGSLSAVSSGHWVQIGVKAVSVKSGVTYWLAFLGTGGSLVLRDRAAAPCDGATPRHRSVRSLPRVWPSRRGARTCFVSAFASGSGSSLSSGGTVHGPNSPSSGSATIGANPASGSSGSPPSDPLRSLWPRRRCPQ